MTYIMIDTHVVLWLYVGAIEKMSVTAQQNIETNQLLISPIVLLELQYLFEIKKVLVNSEEIYEYLSAKIGLKIEEKEPWSKIIKKSIKLDWTRDPFDRLITAHSDLLQCNLITKDSLILSNFARAVW